MPNDLSNTEHAEQDSPLAEYAAHHPTTAPSHDALRVAVGLQQPRAEHRIEDLHKYAKPSRQRPLSQQGDSLPGAVIARDRPEPARARAALQCRNPRQAKARWDPKRLAAPERFRSPSSVDVRRHRDDPAGRPSLARPQPPVPPVVGKSRTVMSPV